MLCLRFCSDVVPFCLVSLVGFWIRSLMGPSAAGLFLCWFTAMLPSALLTPRALEAPAPGLVAPFPTSMFSAFDWNVVERSCLTCVAIVVEETENGDEDWKSEPFDFKNRRKLTI